MFEGISKKEVIDFNKTFSLLLLSRLPVVQSFEVLIMQTTNEKLKKILKSVLHDLKGGQTLSKSFSKYPKYFSEVYIANLRVAEETGQIAQVLNEFTIYTESIENLKRKIMQALQYPVLVLFVAFAVVNFMVFFLIPSFQNLFSSTKVSLPGITLAIIDFSKFVKDNSLVLFVFFAVSSVIIYNYVKSKQGKYYVNLSLVKLPYVSKLYKKNILSRFSYSMALLLRNSVTLTEALKISKNITKNSIFKSDIDYILRKITKGETFSANVNKSVFFDPTFSKLLSAGEETAQLEKVFQLIGEFYEKEFNYQLENITSLIEPFLILFIGIVVAIILVAMYLPMFELINNFGV